jgi:hypothetical protein
MSADRVSEQTGVHPDLAAAVVAAAAAAAVAAAAAAVVLQDVKVIRKRNFLRMPNTIAVSRDLHCVWQAGGGVKSQGSGEAA